MLNFRFCGFFDVFPLMVGLSRSDPTNWKPVEARGERNIPMIGLGASMLLRAHHPITKENWLSDLPVRDTVELIRWKAMHRLLPRLRSAVMKEHDEITKGQRPLLTGEMARAMVSRLDPGSTIFWHVDDGPYHSRTARWHYPLITNPACFHYSGPETLHMEAGCLFYFNNHVRHSASNFGKTPRYHLIFEMYRTTPEDDGEG